MIEALKIELEIENIKESILKTRKIKLKSEDIDIKKSSKKDPDVKKSSKLHIRPHDKSRE